MSGGAGGCAQGPVHRRWLRKCLCIACGGQGSTSHACCRTARASFGLRCDAGPFLGLWACMFFFALHHCVPCMYIYNNIKHHIHLRVGSIDGPDKTKQRSANAPVGVAPKFVIVTLKCQTMPHHEQLVKHQSPPKKGHKLYHFHRARTGHIQFGPKRDRLLVKMRYLHTKCPWQGSNDLPNFGRPENPTMVRLTRVQTSWKKEETTVETLSLGK